MHLTPISSAGKITLATGMMFFQASGSKKWEELGIVEPCEVKSEFQDTTMFDPRGGVRAIAEKDTTQTTVTVTATCKMLTDRVRALGWASDLTYENQAAVTAGTKTFAGVEVGGIYDVGKLNISNVTLADMSTAAVAYVLGTNYEVDAEAGLIRLISLPGANTGLTVTYDAAASLTAAKRPRLGIGSKADLRGGFMCRGTNTVGVRQLVKIPILQFRPSGTVSLSTEDFTVVQIEGTAFIDSTAAQGEELGTVQTLD